MKKKIVLIDDKISIAKVVSIYRVSPKNRLYRLTCLYNCLLLPHETVGSIKNGVS